MANSRYCYNVDMFLLEVVHKFCEYNVGYALTGGHAVSLHGAHRGTFDLDFLLTRTAKNLQMAERALNELGLTSDLPLNSKLIYENWIEYQANRNLVAWSFTDVKAPLRKVDLLVIYDLADFEFEVMKIQRVSVNVVSKKSLIELKQRAGRVQDLEDIRALTQSRDSEE